MSEIEKVVPTKLYAALIKFQGEVPKILKDKENPHFRSMYADLASIIETIRKPLTANKLGITQPIVTKLIGDKYENVILTRIIHESGEFIESEMILPYEINPQKLGSLITYYRRYSLLSLVGLASEEDDDDANRAADKGSQGSRDQGQRTPPPGSNQGSHEKPASPAQLNALKNMGAEILPGLTMKQASALIEELNKKKK